VSAATLPAVLTVAELAHLGHAREVGLLRFREDGSTYNDERFEITAHGQRLLKENMHARAAWLLEHPEEARALDLGAVSRARAAGKR
jgi:hypothetical protein